MKKSRLMKSMKKLTPVSPAQVWIEGSFWGERLRVNREVDLPLFLHFIKSA